MLRIGAPLALVISLLLPSSVSAAAPHTFGEFANQIVALIDAAIIVLVVAAMVWYLWGITSSVQKGKDEGSGKLKLYVTYGIGILFVMVSVWGIVQLLQNSLFGTTGGGLEGGDGIFDSPNFFPSDFES